MATTAQPLPLTFHLFHRSIRGQLLEWFRQQGKEFPWRKLKREEGATVIVDPYVVLVSEVMLQQTQAARVAARLPEFLGQFPSLGSLAAASTATLLRAWQGMGYNRRALRLQGAARAIMEDHAGVFPSDATQLRALPGLGEYTVRAIQCFAFGMDVPVVDVNIQRVLSRLFFRCHWPRAVMPPATVMAVAAAMLPAGEGFRWNQALMDLGSTICTARKPNCSGCPLHSDCASAEIPQLTLFHPDDVRTPEPTLCGIPQRFWRGKMVEALRHAEGGVPAHRLVDDAAKLLGYQKKMKLNEEREGLNILAALLQEGLATRIGVQEGELREGDVVMLPR
ncbi:MAG: A/G-specific adenine glycosylase [Armatimonadetes bacterium]|nr:A/G-specific adenine glycosylase [Armatimonadota bacterium]